ncbi:hypothetical protein AX14_014085 [Amanita brunnescens Koide BX004]|nr:hypothetical protein AX14_014085 [Amanita brunnescens Koide BX004]
MNASTLLSNIPSEDTLTGVREQALAICAIVVVILPPLLDPPNSVFNAASLGATTDETLALLDLETIIPPLRQSAC